MTTTMTRYGLLDQLAASLRTHEQEIHRYRIGETLMSRRQLGWEHAASEWMDRHFHTWKRSQWELAVQQALVCVN